MAGMSGAPAQPGGTGGTAPSRGAGSVNGAAGRTGGVAGVGTAPDAGSDAGSPVDYSLGGFNQELPAPTVDCSSRSILVGCFAFSGTYDQKAFDIACSDDSHVVDGDGPHYVFGCDQTVFDGQRFDVELNLFETLTNTSATSFGGSVPSAQAFPEAFRPERNLDMYPNRDYAMYAYGATHDLAFHFAARSEPAKPSFRVSGAFAFSLVPKPTCVPDSMGFGCDEIRARGNFQIMPASPH